MAKIKFTKGELKAQRDALQQFRRYLPTLQLKKQQLQLKVFEAAKQLQQAAHELEYRRQSVLPWIGLLADPLITRTDARGLLLFDVRQYIFPADVVTTRENIAGALVPLLHEVLFPPLDYDLLETPFWVDRAVEKLREVVRQAIEVWIIRERIRVLEQELRTTTHRVNLFEKVKIPEALENIRRINIYLGDQQANAVGIAKTAKRKLERAASAAGPDGTAP